MSNDSTATLDSFHPTSIDDISEPSPESVVELFDTLDSFRTQVRVNDRTTPYLVGRRVNNSPETYELYYPPESSVGTGVAGTIAYKHRYGEPDEDRVGFREAPAFEADETIADQSVIPVQSLTVEDHTRTEQLDAVLPLLRDSLLDADWTVDPATLDDDELDLSSGRFLLSPDDVNDPRDEPWLPVRGDSGYGEWITAVNELADFRQDAYTDAPFSLSTGSIFRTKTMHGIARYPLGARQIVSHIDEEFVEDGENPEALRTFLLDYAITNLDLDTIDIPLTATTINRD